MRRLKRLRIPSELPEPNASWQSEQDATSGKDHARLNTLFLAMPILWKGALQQDVGRLHRLLANKKEVIVYDYLDGAVPMVAGNFWLPREGYEAAGYSQENELLLSSA